MRESEMFSPTVTKGAIPSGHTIITFDAVRDCSGDRCPISEACPYTHAGKCTVETKFLKNIFASIVDNIDQNKMTQELLNKITLHLMPLYHQLIRFKKKAFSIEDVCFMSVQGGPRIHPIFREIRECIRHIESTQRSMGIDGEYERAMGLDRFTGRGRSGELGSPEAWEQWQKPSLGREVFPDGIRKEVKRVPWPIDIGVNDE